MAYSGARGEAVLSMEGEDYPILFTNRALAHAERTVGKPMLQLLQALQNNTLGINDTAQLLAVGLEFGRRDAKSGSRMMTVDDAWRIMDTLGFTAVVTAVLRAIADVLSYSGKDEAEGERPPA